MRIAPPLDERATTPALTVQAGTVGMLGATRRDGGIDFAVASQSAAYLRVSRMWVCQKRSVSWSGASVIHGYLACRIR